MIELWGECIIGCGYELTTVELYLIMLVVLPFVFAFISSRD